MAEVKSLLKGNLRYVAKILPITLLNILLPTIDIVSDVYMIVKLYVGVYECKWTSTEEIDDYWSCRNDSHNFCSNSNTANDNICTSITHPIYATVLFLPFFVTYSVCFYSWSQSEKGKSNNFLYPLLGMYPQFEALSVIKCLYKDFEEGLAMKKIYESKISLHEVFLEAVPTSFIYTFLFVRAYVGHSNDAGLDTILFGDISDLQAEVLFFITFSSSVFSASLGLAKCLKVGVAKTISSSGPLDGLLNSRFLIAMVASALALISKGVIIGFIVINHIGDNDCTLPASADPSYCDYHRLQR